MNEGLKKNSGSHPGPLSERYSNKRQMHKGYNGFYQIYAVTIRTPKVKKQMGVNSR